MSLDQASLNIPGVAVRGQVGKEFPDIEHLRRERAYKERGAEIMKVLQKQWAGESRWFFLWVLANLYRLKTESSCWKGGIRWLVRELQGV